MDNPGGLTMNSQGYMLVADFNNNRILALNPTLSEARILPLPYNETGTISKPWSLWLDESRGRLYVTENAGQNRVLVYDGVFNLCSIFAP